MLLKTGKLMFLKKIFLSKSSNKHDTTITITIALTLFILPLSVNVCVRD